MDSIASLLEFLVFALKKYFTIRNFQIMIKNVNFKTKMFLLNQIKQLANIFAKYFANIILIDLIGHYHPIDGSIYLICKLVRFDKTFCFSL